MQELRRRCTAGQGLADTGPADLAGRGGQAGPVPGRVRHPGRRALPHGRRGRLAARRDAHAGERRSSSARCGCWPAPRCSASTPTPPAGSARSGPPRATSRPSVCAICCGVWSPRIAADGRGQDPAHPDRAPDDQRRPDPAVRRHPGRDQLPDRPGRGHEHVRAPARRRHGGRLVRAPADHRGARRHPLDRGGGALPDRDAVHPGRLRPAADAGPGADAGPARRRAGRHPLRHQRADLDDAGRAPGDRRDARGARAVVGRGELDQGRARDRPRGRGVDERRRARDRHPRGRHLPVLRPPAHHRARDRAGPRGLQQDVRDRPPGRAVGVGAAGPAEPGLRPRARPRGGVHRDRGVGAAQLVRVERRGCSSATPGG